MKSDAATSGSRSREQVSAEDEALPLILQALQGLQWGQVTVIIQDGRVTQVDRVDRYRLPATAPRPAES